jgi:hypothetical protein
MFLVAAACMVTLATGCARTDENRAHREWRVADDATASAEEIIDAGGPVDVARNGGLTVVTWEVQPEDDEGPYQGAWRLYGADGEAIADGRFKQVFEASGRIEVRPYGTGFVLVSYVRRQLYLLDRTGKVRRPAKGANLAAILGQDRATEDYADLSEWRLQMPGQKRLVRWSDLPTDEPQGMVVAGGELWVGMPRKQDYERGRIAHSKTGRAPWVVETIPNPPGTAIDSETIGESGGALFAVAVNYGSNDDRVDVVSILRRPLKATGAWESIDATGIDSSSMTFGPRITQLSQGRLLASGEGAWLSRPGGGWEAVRLPKSDRPYPPSISSTGSRLWSLGPWDLHFSDDLGRTWQKFDR